MVGTRLVPVMIAAALFAALAVYVVPRGIAARDTLAMADDPVRIADRALATNFNSAVATREIEAALADNDADLARSFVELADTRHVPLDPALTAKVNAAVAEASSTSHTLVSFARGFVTGVPEDGAALAGTALGDLFVFGDIRDAAREGTHLALGEPADKMILGLACVGFAITAGTYATVGLAAPARVGLTLAKAARKTGRLGGRLAVAIGRMVRQAVDWSRLRKAVPACPSPTPAAAARVAREAVKVERAGGLLNLAADVGRIERKAGARAAMESLEGGRRRRRNCLARRQACRQGRRQDPRHHQAARPRRHHADRRQFQSRHLDTRRAVHACRLGLLAQRHDRARHLARGAPPQGAPPAERAAALRGADRRARLTRAKRFSHVKIGGECFAVGASTGLKKPKPHSIMQTTVSSSKTNDDKDRLGEGVCCRLHQHAGVRLGGAV